MTRTGAGYDLAHIGFHNLVSKYKAMMPLLNIPGSRISRGEVA
jgi:hypothetical protein